MAEFDEWAEWYDVVHRGLPGESEFYLHEAKQCTGTVLELGCGTGRIAIPIVEQGTNLVGLDLSLPMLDECTRKWDTLDADTTANLTLVQGDMSAFKLDQLFPLVIMPYRSFMHLLETEQQRSCLNCIAAHLEPGGRFMMNTWVPLAAYIYAFGSAQEELQQNHIDTYALEEGGGEIEHFHSVIYQELNQHMREEHVFVRKDASGTEVGQKTLSLERTWLGIREMKNLIASSDLELEAVWGDFKQESLGNDHTEALWVLKKPSA